MSLTIINIEHFDFSTRSGFKLDFKASSEKDFFMAQEIFRAILTTNSIESSFGYDKNYNDIFVFEYPQNKRITLKCTLYLNKEGYEIEAFWRKNNNKDTA